VLCGACGGLALLGASGATAQTVSFTTPGCTTWTVPVGSHFQTEAVGGPGSPGGSYEFESQFYAGGAGGRADAVSAPLPELLSGTQVFVCVDVGGGAGGGSQAASVCEACFVGGAGGGASGVSLGNDFSQPVLVAAGGGGGGGRPPYAPGEPPYDGGAAGEPGGGGERNLAPPYNEYDGDYGDGGGAGSPTEGGAGGAGGLEGTAGAAGSAFSAEAPGAGGAGGFGKDMCLFVCEGGGGGGGGAGYYGGGGGGGGGIDGGGGGGGSSLTPPGGSVELASAAVEPRVQITYTPGPSAVTEPASEVAQTTATANATVNPNGQATVCQFEYGPTELYGWVAPCEQSPGSGTSAIGVSAALAELAPRSVYHFRIVATNEGATSYGGDQAFETLPNPPEVASVSPDAGLEAGGTAVTIAGTRFAEATAVKFGSIKAAHFTINSSTSITATAPAETAGTVAVTVANAGGVSPTSPGDAFTYVAPGHAPTITALSTRSGPAAGGTVVTVTGTSFTGVTAVKFGAVNAASYKVNSATSITAESPAQTTGTVEVSVTTPNGESGLTSKSRFTFGSPTVTGVSPNTGPKGGGTSVVVTGSGFAPGGGATTFVFGKASATAVNCTSTTTCTMLSPAVAKTRAVDVRAKAGGKTSKKSPPADQFIYD